MTGGFSAIGIVGLVMLFGSMIFGHDHDGEVHDGDNDHDGDGSISIFSFKVIGSFLVGFGASATLAVYQLNVNNFKASLVGIGFGVLMAFVSWWLLTLINKQQGNSLIISQSLIGTKGSVTISIDPVNPGEVAFNHNGTFMTRTAKSKNSAVINKGEIIEIVDVIGSDVIVEKTNNKETK